MQPTLSVIVNSYTPTSAIKVSVFLISTPICNLRDISYRAVETLKLVDLIAVEDTRISGRLLKEYGIEGRMTSFFEQNETN